MDKFSKIIIGISAIMVSLAASYYLFFFLPSSNKERDAEAKKQYIDKMQRECQQLGSSILKEMEQIFQERYYYSPGKNKCYYSYNTVGDLSFESFAIDAYENKPVLRFRMFTGGEVENCDICVLSLFEFNKQRDLLFRSGK